MNVFEEEIARAVALTERAVLTREPRLIARVLRSLGKLRRCWNGRLFEHRTKKLEALVASEIIAVDLFPEDAEALKEEQRKKQRARQTSSTGAEQTGTDSTKTGQKTGTPDEASETPVEETNGKSERELGAVQRFEYAVKDPVLAAQHAHAALRRLLERLEQGDPSAHNAVLLEDVDAALEPLLSRNQRAAAAAKGLGVVQPLAATRSEASMILSNGVSTDSQPNETAAAGLTKQNANARQMSGVSWHALQPESLVLLHLLVVYYLLDAHGDHKLQLRAVDCADRLISLLDRSPRRHTMDEIAARCYYAFTLAYECVGRLSECQPRLLKAYRTACVRRDHAGQAVLLNQLLRSYVLERRYAQADQLYNRAPFPDIRSNSQLARYFYYIGRVKAIQLDYTEAFRCLNNALRKAPQHMATAFRITILRLLVLVQLLMGEIPELQVFLGERYAPDAAVFRRAMYPYLQIANAVRRGDLQRFQQVLEENATCYEQDGNGYLVRRLRHNVIKTGLARIVAAYARIPLKEVQEILGLDDSSSTENVVAKAIRDRVIRANIDRDQQCLVSASQTDQYQGREPARMFHERIQFCMDLHEEVLRAMRFPDDKRNEANLEILREMQRDEAKIEQALAEGAEPGDEDDTDDIL
ncbi:26S proteasome regulatory subunit RPN3 [Cyanidioschyzon merolae strain 10D]|uniref:26S proteasome regulatory subunit RPN3 n=1 Tax=Cyanidioschyzon merolae (strain NIES-3377 / 10D) TaxID=280699 RepID=M1USQ7_CYAM1|nr:26S proteasome regulatory subunit RPN3 [Cyanidioschyzon merolae strain 10D]BAM80741.1 26S proteasome regulatory subunit RPN3 [Cyanidioschyzon merolae strain 10D]|eukprot:XP_005536777.1 26S proteasome regulatory subunit RPN3 [Cyanidioschyzon merolae strain 10D]